MSFPLSNNNANIQSNLVKQQQQWKKPELHYSRSSREKTKENDIKTKSSYPNLSTEEFLARKKKFSTFKFYLDNLEPNIQKRIERGIKLLGANQETFFSNKCTHVITAKNIPIYENLLQPSTKGDTNSTKATNYKKTHDGPKDSLVDSAIQWNLVLWSVDVMWKTVEYFLKSNCGSRKETQEKRALGKALQEEKLYGLSTGANNSDSQTKRPHFIPFTGHYVIVEDAAQVHKPPILKQYTKEVFTKKQSEYPWPFLKTTPKYRSPFGKRMPPNNPKKENPDEQQQPQPQNNDKENIDPNQPIKQSPPPLNPIANTTSIKSNEISLPLKSTHISNNINNNNNNNNNNSSQPKLSTPIANQHHQDDSHYSLRASGFQPYTPSASTTTTVSTAPDIRRLPPGESVNRLDKRMVENIPQKLNKHAIEKEMMKQEILKKKRDSKFCENCNMVFENLDEHLKEKTHQTFVRDQNNFKQLDLLLEKTHRVYKGPLPEHMKNLVDVNIDGKNVVFTGKRSLPSSPQNDNARRRKLLHT